jgi:hypothetical protein
MLSCHAQGRLYIFYFHKTASLHLSCTRQDPDSAALEGTGYREVTSEFT